MDYNILLLIFALLMVPGIISIFIPMFPAIMYMVLIAFVFSAINHFNTITIYEFIVLFLALPISIFVDYSAGILGAKYGGASRKALLWGFFGAIVGFFAPIPFGAFLGMFLGIFISEIKQDFGLTKSIRSGLGGIFGMIAGMFINLIIAIILFCLFIIFAVF